VRYIVKQGEEQRPPTFLDQKLANFRGRWGIIVDSYSGDAMKNLHHGKFIPQIRRQANLKIH